MRLMIDARMWQSSGIGVYLRHVLPGVVAQCQALRPMLVVSNATEDVRSRIDAPFDVVEWNVPPLTIGELRSPRLPDADVLWWSPHFNVPLLTTFPLVATIHDVLPLARPDGVPSIHRAAVRIWLGAIRRRARRIIADSEFTRGELVRVARLDATRIETVALGVDTPLPASKPAVAEPYILFVGLVKPHKNLLGLLKAFQQIAPSLPHRLVVVGKHTGLREVDEDAIRLARALTPRVELMEDVPADRLNALTQGADILVQPSFYEGFGLPPLEAMAAGTPVLAARAGALPEVCGDAALYCDPRSVDDIAHGLRSLLSDDALRADLRARGLARARLYRWDACVDRTASILLEAANSTRRSGAQ